MAALGAPTAANAKKKSNKVTLSDKLRNVPAFFVANSRGSPYLINKEQEGAQECVIFLEPGDADARRRARHVRRFGSGFGDARAAGDADGERA